MFSTAPILADHFNGVYFIAPTDEGPTKIGITTNLQVRAAQLQTGAWLPLKIYGFRLAMFRAGAGRYRSVRDEFNAAACTVEAAAHSTLRDLGFGLCGEWFDVSPAEALLVVKKCAGVRGAALFGVEDLAGVDLAGRADVQMLRSRSRLVKGMAEINTFIVSHNEGYAGAVDGTK